MIRKSLFLILTVFLLGGCVANLDTSVPPISTTTRVPGKTYPSGVTPSATPLPTDIPGKIYPSRETPSATLLPTNTPNTTFRRQCLQVNTKENALQNVSSGTVFLYNKALGLDNHLVDIQTGKKYKIPAQQAKEYGWGEISPDGKMYTYGEDVYNDAGDLIEGILWVVDAHADLLAKISFNHEIRIPHWLSNERIVLEIGQTDTDGSVLLVNPFTREERIISNELPGLYTYTGINAPTWRVEYSPDLEWVAYINIQSIIVRDVTIKQTIWQSTDGPVDKPAWSPDGQQVAIANYEDRQLYLVSRAGQVKPILPNQIRSKDTSWPSWSPDGQYLVFLNKDDLMLYSKLNNEVTDLCFPGRPNMFTQFEPVWSPDSQQLFVSSEGLVDLQKKVAYINQEIINNEILFWMNSLP